MTASFGLFIKRRRLALKKSGRQLARESGVSSGYLSQIEAGRFIPKPAVIKKLAVPLHIGLDQLLIEADILPEMLAEEPAGYRSLNTFDGQKLTEDEKDFLREQLELFRIKKEREEKPREHNRRPTAGRRKRTNK